MSEVQPEMGEDSRLPWTNVTSVSLHFYAYRLCMYVCMYIGLLSFLSFLAFKLTMDKQVTMKKAIYIYVYIYIVSVI